MRVTPLALVALASCSFPRPADVPDIDASADAAVDASGSIDAQPDAMLPPPVITGQIADLVLGQPDFDQNTENNGGVSSRTLHHPKDVWSDGTYVWVADVGNRRVLQWNSFPQISFTVANAALGEANTSDTQSTVDQYKIGGGPVAALVTNTRLGGTTFGAKVFVADPSFNRVLAWIPIPQFSGANAALELGYPSFSAPSNTPANPPTASTLGNCSAVWSDGTRIAVADTANNRVLIWDSIPGANGQGADLVLGQAVFTTNAGSVGPASMNQPMGVEFDGKHLFVADTGNNRVMVWNGWPTQSGKAADYFVGQGSGTVSVTNAGASGPNEIGLDHPTDVIVANGALFVADMGNHRVVMHYPIPTTSGTKAQAALGQIDLKSKAVASGAAGMSNPMGLGMAPGYLFVADTGNNRVLRFRFAM